MSVPSAFANLRGAQHHRAALQELRALLCPDRPHQRGILRPRTARRPNKLPGDRCVPTVDAEAGRRPGVQGIPPGVQAPFCVDQSWAHQRRRFLRLERASQSAEKAVRQGRHHPGGVSAVAEGVVRQVPVFPIEVCHILCYNALKLNNGTA